MEKYRKVKMVGKGNFGHALLVQSIADRKFYIMKIIDISRMDQKQREEALNEVHVLKAMRHPYIVTYRESFMSKSCLCIVMDYADGGDMYYKIAQQKKLGKPFPEELVLDWFVQIALALKHVHDRKILHRDLKTQNIFLTSKQEIKIGDFGISRVLQHTYDCAKTAIGTPYYLSPEICQERPYNQKSDIWSMGCIIYEILTFKHAFDSTSMKGLVLKILRGSYPPIPACYSDEVRCLVSEMLKKDPKKRPSIRKILEKDFLSNRISKLLSRTVAKHEFTMKKTTPLGDALTGEGNRDIRGADVTATTRSTEKSRVLEENRQFENKLGKYGDVSGVGDEQKNDIVVNSKMIVHGGIGPKGGKEDPKSFYRQNSENVIKKSPSLIKSKGAYNRQEEEKDKSVQPGNIVRSSFPAYPKSKGASSQSNRSPDSCSYQRKTGGGDQEEYKMLIDSLKKCLKKGSQEEEEDENIMEEAESQRVFAKFLTPEGQELPDVCECDTITYRVESLRYYLEVQLGEELFIRIYNMICDQMETDDDGPNAQQLLGPIKSKFLPLIYQMIVCEDTLYSN